MPFEFIDSPIDIRPDLPEAFRLEWERLAAPGTWFSGADRVEIAAEARRAIAGERAGNGLPDPLRSVVRRVAAESPSISAFWVSSLPADGVEFTGYVEVVGIVSRLSAVDFFHGALGLPLEPLPQPRSGEPTRTPPPPGAVDGRGFVPMVPPIDVTASTSLVPPESVDWQRLSDATYMTLEEMGNPDFRRALHRTQMELVAARTSQINECFY